MKTTLKLDDDIADFLQEQSHIQDKPLEQVVNETLRLGITRIPKRVDAAKPPFRVKPNKSGLAEGVDPLHLNRLIDDLEVENYLAWNEPNINPSPDEMSLEAAYGSVKPSNMPEDFNEITAIAKQAKAEETAQELNDEWNY
ncbi:MAG: hypothetical protein F4Y44_03710 [Chloroflexi bacterium]|nr:hypothetical protein [Chloroflexota bacterium]